MKIKKLLLVICMLYGTNSAMAACTLNSTPMYFGTYSILNQADGLVSSSTINVNCDFASRNRPITIKFGWGNSGLVAPAREMRNSMQDHMNYNIFIDATRSYNKILGDGTSSSVFISGTGQTNTVYTIYGVVYSGQNLSAGNYSDTVSYTITF